MLLRINDTNVTVEVFAAKLPGYKNTVWIDKTGKAYCQVGEENSAYTLMPEYIIVDDCIFGYPTTEFRNYGFLMLVLAVDASRGGNPLLINEEVPINSTSLITSPQESDYDRFHFSTKNIQYQLSLNLTQ